MSLAHVDCQGCVNAVHCAYHLCFIPLFLFNYGYFLISRRECEGT